MKNSQLQEAMKYVYDSDNILDDGLGDIKDDTNEAISKDNTSFKMLISKDEIDDVKKMLSEITLQDLNFSQLCNTKTWEE